METAGHLRILMLLAVLIAGTGLVFYSFQVYRRFRHSFMQPMWLGFLMLNLAYLAGTLADYALVNMFGDIMTFKASPFMTATGALSSLAFLAVSFLLLGLERTASRGSVAAPVTWAFALAASLVIVSSLLDELGAGDEARRAIFLLRSAALTAAFLLCVSVLARMAFAGARIEKASGVGGWRELGAFYLSGCAVILFTAAFAPRAHPYVYALAALGFNLFPFYWLRRRVVGPGSAIEQSVEGADFTAFYERHGISARQREVAELVLGGKSNREIAEALFIAPHTAKNHIYNLYRKLGVKSRFEMINLFLENLRG